MSTAIQTLLPPMAPVRIAFDAPAITDIPGIVRKQFAASGVSFQSGEKIAVCCGSRGIANIATVTKTLIEELRKLGVEPFIVPAMGSHGGATAEGQQEVLESYGISESGVGAPVRSSMETVSLNSGSLPHPLFMDRNAFEADGVILVNRVKPHTDFRGPIESGLMKMAVIGLGKRDQAETMHAFGVPGLRDMIVPAARQILATGKIRMGIGIVENARDETMELKAVSAAELEKEEEKLLRTAHASMPRLPLDDIDVLIVDEIGKDISGCGMDTNIIGRMRIAGEPEPERPRIRRIVCTDLTPASHGNAIGIGLADLMTQRLADKIDRDATNANLFTSTFLERGMLPPALPTTAEAVEWALKTCNLKNIDRARVVRIRNTLKLEQMWVSEAAWEAIEQQQKRNGQAPDEPGASSKQPVAERTGDFTPALDASGAFIDG